MTTTLTLTQTLSTLVDRLRSDAKAARDNADAVRADDPFRTYLLWRAGGIKHAANALGEVLAEVAKQPTEATR